MSSEYKEWQARLDSIRRDLSRDPTNIDLGRRYWRELRGPGGADVRTGREALIAFRGGAIASPRGAVALAAALKELGEDSGEFPDPAKFDQELCEALRRSIGYLSDAEAELVRWLLTSLNQ